MKIGLVVLTLLFSNIIFANQMSENIRNICVTSVTKGVEKSKLSKKEALAVNECTNRGMDKVKECQVNFSKSIKGLDTSKKSGLIKLLEEQQVLIKCNSNISIEAIKKYF